MKNKESGEISKVLIIIAIIWLIVIVVVYFIISATNSRKEQSAKESEQANNEPLGPVYEKTLGDVRFVFQSAKDLGNLLRGKNSFENISTTERFIKVTVGAQNKGSFNVPQSQWDIGNLIDSEGRNFVTINPRAFNFVPKPDLCGVLLKPEFEPASCVKLYEVSKASEGFKVEIITINASNKKQRDLLDLSLSR